jgi:hypothetical protein
MKRTDLQNLAESQPFRPFMLETSGGTAVDVLRAEDIFLPPRRPDLAIIFDFSGRMFILDAEHITGLVTK